MSQGPDNRSLNLEDIQRDLERWDKRLQRLHDVYDRHGAEVNDAYVFTLDELRFSLEELRDEINRAKEGGAPVPPGTLQRLGEARDRTQRLFDTKLSTMRHQKM